MPFVTKVTPFTGDGNMRDFMRDEYVPFARDECKWVDNQAPSPGKGGAGFEEFWLTRQARGGSPISVLSPFTPEPPFVFYEAEDDHLYIYVGDEIDTTERIDQQPNSPANTNGGGLVDDLLGLSYVGSGFRCPVINDIIGTYDAYWLFCDDLGRYIHCVVKVRSREYRHFHVGLLTALHPDLDERAFYVTGHFWDQLNRRFTGVTTESGVNGEHDPYNSAHRIPFASSASGNELGNPPGPRMAFTSTWLYMPGLNSHDWYTCRGAARGDELLVEETPTKSSSPQLSGVSPNNWADAIGTAQTTSYGGGMGVSLFNADRTFTSNTNSLVPIFVGANIDFQSDIRMGVVAQIPDVFRINMRDFAPGEEITVGSDTYVVFPMINDDAANVLTGEGYSGYEGLAYKKIDNGSVP